jgi:hypothetical protein
MMNSGSLDSQYDAQVANLKIVPSKRNHLEGGSNTDAGYAALFRFQSRFSIFGVGPLSAGDIVSFSMWIKPRRKAGRTREMVLFHYGNVARPKGRSSKLRLTLTIKRGVPVLYFRPDLEFKALGTNIADGEWHHIAVSMPSKSCLASEVEVFVDGAKVETVSRTHGVDDRVFFVTDGRISLGGLGYSSEKFSAVYPSIEPFRGWMDDFRLMNRPFDPWQDI